MFALAAAIHLIISLILAKKFRFPFSQVFDFRNCKICCPSAPSFGPFSGILYFLAVVVGEKFLVLKKIFFFVFC